MLKKNAPLVAGLAVCLLIVASFAALVVRNRAGAGTEVSVTGMPLSKEPEVSSAAKKLLIRCQGEQKCTSKELQGLVASDTAEFSLKVLDELSARNAAVLSASHAIAHEIGDATYKRFVTLPDSLSQCRDNASSGCHHGVMMSYIAKNGIPGADLLRVTCDQIKARGQMPYFNCLHGLGHGIMLGRILLSKGVPGSSEIQDGLRDCDALAGEYEQRSCYGGMFMEFIVAAKFQIFHYAVKPKYRADDVHWPCSAVADRYAEDCYLSHGRYILDEAKWNHAAAFETCGGARTLEGQRGCVTNIGRETNAAYRGQPAKLVESCGRATDPNHRGWCLSGAVRETLHYNADVAYVINLCKLGDGPGVALCHEAVRQDTVFHGWTPEQLQKEYERLGVAPI